MIDIKFYKCLKCGSVAIKPVDSGVPLFCCGEPMTELVVNTSDAATEKHVPVIAVDGATVTVSVGEVEHPMTEEHYIQFIVLHTNKGTQCARLQPGDAPKVVFALAADVQVIEAFAYCNLHGLWSAKA